MAKILEIFFVTLLITILQGFPQKSPQKPHVDTVLGQDTKYNPNKRNEEQKKPLDRHQIYTPPGASNAEKQGISQYRNTNRKIRQANEEVNPLDVSQISTLPAHIQFADEDVKQFSKETDNREIRNAEKDDSSEENSSKEDSSEENSREKIKPGNRIQPYRLNNREKDSSEED